MPRKPESRDACPYCGEIIPNHGVAKHQAQCPKWHEILLTAESGTQPVETLWHLRVQVAYNKNIWLDLEMLGTASLDKLDKYLCAFRLDYCGHQGMFRIVGCSEKKIGKAHQTKSTFETGLLLRHLHDFSTTSETDIRVVGFREEKTTTQYPIALLARNRMPEAVCQECLYEAENGGYLCGEHVKIHPHEYDGAPMRLVNSPNSGIWDYDDLGEPSN
jgi:hypothetical protein